MRSSARENSYLKAAILALLATLAASCASVQPYARFAQAGSVYSTALDRLLVAAANIAIDATSERLLQDDKLSNQDLASYRKLSTIDEERLAITGRLRAHARVLAQYFGLLNELATSDAPQHAQQAMEGMVKNLNAIGKQLRGSELVQNKDVFTAITKIVVGFTIRAMLRDELNKRKETIQVELKTQEELLKALAKAIKHDLTIINEAREKRVVIDPLVSPIPIARPDEWVANRRLILTSQARVAELDKASEAAQGLRKAFEDLVTDRLSIELVNALLTDLESIVAVAEAINR